MGQVAIYCRVSTDDQACERQEWDLRAFAKHAGHKIVAVFKETASGADNARPQRAKVLALARAHEIDAILVTELSRWGRSTQDLVQTLDDLHGWKVSILAQTGLSFDLSTASGKQMRTIMAGLAEFFERDLIRERVKSGLASARARGVKPISGLMRPPKPPATGRWRSRLCHARQSFILSRWPCAAGRLPGVGGTVSSSIADADLRPQRGTWVQKWL